MKTLWYLYILRCADGTLYTGITTDVHRRIAAHQTGKGAKYTRGRGPLVLAYEECCGSHSEALKREAQIKRLSRGNKLLLLSSGGNAQEREASEAKHA